MSAWSYSRTMRTNGVRVLLRPTICICAWARRSGRRRASSSRTAISGTTSARSSPKEGASTTPPQGEAVRPPPRLVEQDRHLRHDFGEIVAKGVVEIDPQQGRGRAVRQIDPAIA